LQRMSVLRLYRREGEDSGGKVHFIEDNEQEASKIAQGKKEEGLDVNIMRKPPA